jgi:hypothetical protein
MDHTLQNARPRTKQEEEYTRYWATKTPAERIAETWRLSVEHYGVPKTSLRDGPARRIRRNADGQEEIVEISPLRAPDKQSEE